jgi:hypothetical protein
VGNFNWALPVFAIVFGYLLEAVSLADQNPATKSHKADLPRCSLLGRNWVKSRRARVNATQMTPNGTLDHPDHGLALCSVI